jgi:hypothetical protein
VLIARSERRESERKEKTMRDAILRKCLRAGAGFSMGRVMIKRRKISCVQVFFKKLAHRRDFL